jgi:hypothetical protein
LCSIDETSRLAEVSLTCDLYYENLQNGRLSDDEDEDIPSAPPFCGSTHEIRQANEEIPTSAMRSTPSKVESSTLKSASRDKFENHGDASSEQFVRLVYLIELVLVFSRVLNLLKTCMTS